MRSEPRWQTMTTLCCCNKHFSHELSIIACILSSVSFHGWACCTKCFGLPGFPTASPLAGISSIFYWTSLNKPNSSCSEFTLKCSQCSYLATVWQPLRRCQIQLCLESNASLKQQNPQLITNQIWFLCQEGVTRIWSLTAYWEKNPRLTLFAPINIQDRLFKSLIKAGRSATAPLRDIKVVKYPAGIH